MANTITGRILLIGQTEAIPYQDKVFYKRELVLDASRYDQYSGNKFENYPKFEMTGNNCSQLDQYHQGDLVTVSFVLSGRKVEKDGNVSYFTNVTAYKVEPYQRMAQQPQNYVPQTSQSPAPYQQATQQPQMAQQPQNAAPAASQQPFPPAVDENGNPIGGEDDLPF